MCVLSLVVSLFCVFLLWCLFSLSWSLPNYHVPEVWRGKATLGRERTCVYSGPMAARSSEGCVCVFKHGWGVCIQAWVRTVCLKHGWGVHLSKVESMKHQRNSKFRYGGAFVWCPCGCCDDFWLFYSVLLDFKSILILTPTFTMQIWEMSVFAMYVFACCVFAHLHVCNL